MFLHCDLDSFFVSVERVKNKTLLNKPVAVGGNRFGRGVIASASYEARKFGIHSGMPTSSAKKFYKDLIVIHPHFPLYEKYSHDFFDILYSITPDIQMASIDEAYIDFSHSDILWETPIKMAKAIKETVWEKLDLPLSIGIARAKYLAKISSKTAKPEGIYELKNENEFLKTLPVSMVNGIGKKLQEQLKKLGVYSVGDILQYDQNFWKNNFKSTGDWLYHLAMNDLIEHIEKRKMVKSIGNSETFPEDLTYDKAREYLKNIAEHLGYRMRKKGLLGRTLTLKVRYDNFSTFTNQMILENPTFFSNEIFENAKELFEKYEDYQGRFRLLGITMSQLIDKSKGIEMPLFFNDHDFDNKYRLYQALDTIHNKWGK
ncbi:DNA polymerase IV [bacterium]|nr:DNA polymerase IV [bacterium]